MRCFRWHTACYPKTAPSLLTQWVSIPMSASTINRAMDAPALALDLMEEFRPLVAESAVLTAINTRMITSSDFVTAGKAVNLTSAGRKRFFEAYEQRMTDLVTHPIFDYKVSYRRALELQFRILARVLTGEIPEYIPFTTR